VDVDGGVTLCTFATQVDATRAVLEAGEAFSLEPGQSRTYAVRIESIASGDCYDIPLVVQRQ
jgi:hypothetical protein